MARESKDRKYFKRESLVRELMRRRDANWQKVACQDLKDLAEDEEGLKHLTAAIKAVLRSEKWRR